MKSHNTYSSVGYVLRNLVFGCLSCYFLISITLLRVSMLTKSKTLSMNQSICLLIITILFFIIIGIILTIRHDRNFENTFANALISLGMSCMIITFRYHPKISAFVLIILVCLIMSYIIKVISKKIVSCSDKSIVMARKIRRIVHTSRTVLKVASFCFILLFTFILMFSSKSDAYYPSLPDSFNITTDASIIETNFSIFRLLNESEWSKLDTNEKLNVLACVIVNETSYLGLPQSPRLMADKLPLGTYGTYMHGKNLISISIWHLESSSAKECLNTILHEVYHCYQHNLCDAISKIDNRYLGLRMFAQLADFNDEFANPQYGDAYFNQITETSAREYANRTADEYLMKIERLRDELFE